MFLSFVRVAGRFRRAVPTLLGDLVAGEVEGLDGLTKRGVTGEPPICEDCGAQPSESEEVLSMALGGDWEFRGIRPPRRD